MQRKAQAWQIFPAIVYLMMTSVVVILMVQVPKTILDNAAETYDRDNAIFEERIFNKLSTKDELTTRVIPGVIEKKEQFSTKRIKKSFDLGKTPRRVGFKLTYDRKSIYFNQDFYEDAKPLSPVVYKDFVHQRPLLVENELKQLEIDQVFTPEMKKWE